jgi:hypothetical protein
MIINVAIHRHSADNSVEVSLRDDRQGFIEKREFETMGAALDWIAQWDRLHPTPRLVLA